MTIQEAIKSGKRFKRPEDIAWLRYENGGIVLSTNTLGCDNMSLTADHILADDWEIEEKKVEINRDQFLSAFGMAYCCLGNTGKQLDMTLAAAIMINLGL